jgi:hypothetical protein
MRIGRPFWGNTAASFAFCLLVCLLCGGCLAVPPLPRKTHGPQGTEGKVQLDFLKVGQTRRDEVREKLKAFDTGVQSERFFVGRWTYPIWLWIVPVPYGDAGGRQWSATNMLVDFDENGVVKRFEVLPDRALSRALGPVAGERQRPGPTERVELEIKVPLDVDRPAKIILASDNLEFVGVPGSKGSQQFTIAASKVLSIRSWNSIEPDPAYCDLIIQYTDQLTPLGRPKKEGVNVKVTVRDMVTLLSYTQANGGS